MFGDTHLGGSQVFFLICKPWCFLTFELWKLLCLQEEKNTFSSFIDRHVRKYKNHISLPVHFIGSVAYHFRDIIQVVLEERNMKMGRFVQKPIDHLVNFHSHDN